ncbi:MAG TPA: SRPBCC domain-containing protein [Polyangiales bacterium]|nr:SRPBCC domain-containing protein [Polyangiales bacterium]
MKSLPTVRVETIIPAPRPAVWDVLVDFARYPEWNPFTIGVTTRGHIGDPVLLDVMLGGRRLKMRERMRVHEPERRIGWGLHLLGGALLDCTRIQELEDAGEGSTRYVCQESFRGLSVPLFYGLFRNAMQEGFRANAEALRERVARLHSLTQCVR